jgi:phosphatidylglycerol---prolipoprotein diacylglyceryl transferase
VSAFAFLVGLGASLGLWRVIQRVPRWQASRWMNSALITLLGSLLGSRIVYVAFHTSYYAAHRLEAVEIWKGGLSWPGAVAGGLVGLVAVATIWRLPIALLADRLMPLASPLAIAVWLGCWQSGISYGGRLPPGAWWGIPTRDETGAVYTRFPVQPLAALTLVIFFWWLELKSFPREHPGRLASLAGLGLAVNLLIFSFLRADPSQLWIGVRPDVWMALGLGLFCLLAYALTFRSPRKGN